MFMGEFSCKMDSKGRFMMPVKVREELNEEDFILTKGLENCLTLYKLNEWAKIEEKLLSLDPLKKNERAVQRFFISGATKINFDNQGRLNVPKTLMKYAKMEKEIVVVAGINRIEIWAEELYDEYMNNVSDNISDIADEVNF